MPRVYAPRLLDTMPAHEGQNHPVPSEVAVFVDPSRRDVATEGVVPAVAGGDDVDGLADGEGHRSPSGHASFGSFAASRARSTAARERAARACSPVSWQ